MLLPTVKRSQSPESGRSPDPPVSKVGRNTRRGVAIAEGVKVVGGGTCKSLAFTHSPEPLFSILWYNQVFNTRPFFPEDTRNDRFDFRLYR
jgi:hypothetical protein